jgi:PAS domain S-box-containing protein
MEAALEPLFAIDAEGRITDVNEAAAALTGVSRGRLISTSLTDYFTEPAKAQEAFRRALASGRLEDFPLAISRRTKEPAPVFLSANSYGDTAGKTLGVVAAIRDTAGQSYHLRSVFEASIDPLITLTPEGTISDVNDATVAITGISRENLIGSDFTGYFKEAALAGELYRQASRTGRVRDYPLTFRNSNGTLSEVISNASLFMDNEGEVAGILIAARDVTENNRALNELLEAKSFLDNILQSSTKYSIIGKDQKGRILSWNEGARRNYGYQAEEVIGKDSIMLHAPEDVASGAVEKLMAEAHDNGVAEGEFLRIRKDGSRFVASVVMTRRDDSAGHHIGYLLMSHDITEKKQADERLQQAARHARNLIEASLDPLLTISPEGKITDANEAAAKVTGVSREEMLGTDFPGYFTEPAKAQEAYTLVFQKGLIRDYSLTIRHRDGTETYVLFNASVYRDNRGKVLGAFAAARDITERKRASDKMKELNRTLEQRLAERTAQNQEILQAAKILAGSSTDMMAFMSQIASGVTETAVTVSETSSIVNEVKMTAHLSSDKARKVSEVSQDAVSVSQAGRKAVDDSIDAMGRIQDQVSRTAESITRLSEQSQTIGDIMSTVQDLAEQSNLLAVNAAIEAAKAGDLGRGFGVVAQELKSLAEQSKEATVQVRSILKEVQKATKTAVLATEQGKDVVEAGVRQSRQGGEAIRRLETIISESAQAAVQIGASSRQQLSGMDQVAQAMQNIRQASDDNAAGVKQVETSLQRLNELGQKLKLLVEQYG